MIDEGSTLGSTVGTEGAAVRLLSRVYPDVVTHGIFSGGSVRTVWAGEGLFSCVSTDMFCHAVLPNSGIRTEGTLVYGAARLSPSYS